MSVALALALHVCGLGLGLACLWPWPWLSGLGLDTSGLVNIPGLDKQTNVTDGQPENIMSLSP